MGDALKSFVLSFVTKAGTSPQWLPYVYLCCHPEETGEALDFVKKEIFGLFVDCAIWYVDPTKQGGNVEALLEDIGKMQMTAVYVTEKFLADSALTGRRAVSFALERHIPVLPLVRQAGLEKDFNSVYGNIQCLCESAMPAVLYRETLRHFLQSVLLDETLIKAIQQEFKGYCFLSYRKKDKAYVEKVMKFIHRHDFMRDIGIWYDDYLIPGKNYDDLIVKAMAKSRVFILLVTPNIVNESNYVMTVEYPFASAHGKCVIPVEVAETDHGLLEENYEGLPECLTLNEGEAAGNILRVCFDDAKTGMGKESPQHLLYIGMAYLYGIDVEKDAPRAEELIAEAARRGSADACRRLIFMYRHGEGVPRDLGKAALWADKLIELQYGGEKQIERDESTALHKFYDIRSLGDVCLEKGEFYEAVRHYEDGRRLIEELIVKKDIEMGRHSAEIWAALSDAFLKTADAYYEADEYEKADTYYLQSISIDRAMDENEEISSHDSMKNLGISLLKYGQLKYTCRDAAAAKEALLEGTELLRQLTDQYAWMDPVNGDKVFFSSDNTNFAESVHASLKTAYEYLAEVALLEYNMDDLKHWYKLAQQQAYWVYKTEDSVYSLQNLLAITDSIHIIETDSRELDENAGQNLTEVMDNISYKIHMVEMICGMQSRDVAELALEDSLDEQTREKLEEILRPKELTREDMERYVDTLR